MKRLLVLFLLMYSSASLGQMITTPATQSIEAGTTVDVSDFVVNWPNNTESILISLSLEYHSTATFNLPTTTGLTRNYGYNSWTGINTLVFYGTRDNVNAALAAMTVTMGSVKTAVKINIEVSPFDVSYVYNPVNKHYYKYVASSQISYTNARTGASSNTFLGKTGYLVTITSQSEQDFVNNNISGSNIWIALTDEATTTDGTWKLDGGPELGTIIKTQNGPTAGNIDGQYNNWCTGEPNGANHSEDYAVAKWNGGTCWNDLSNTNTGAVAGYIVEVSADFPSGSTYFTGVYTAYVVHNNDLAYTLATASSSTLSSSNVSNLPNIFGGLVINDANNITLNSSSTLNTNKIVFNGTGKMILTDNTSKWTPGTADLTKTFIHSPSTNSTPSYWSSSSNFNGDAFYANAPYPSVTTGYHFTPWLNSPQGWSAGANDGNQYLILNYPVPAYIAGIVTQGRSINGIQYVSNVNVDVSMDGSTWKRVLTGVNINTNVTESVATLFPTVEYTKFVKVMPTATGFVGHMTMKMGLLIKSTPLVTNGLVLHLDAGNALSYKGTGTTWTDISEKGNHSTLSNSPSYNLPNSGYLTFNGSTQYARIPSVAGLTDFTNTQQYTIEIWFNPSNGQANNAEAELLEKWNYTNEAKYPFTFRFNESGSSMVVACYDGSSFTYVTVSSIPVNTWVQLVANFDFVSKTLTVYKNGVSKVTGSLNGVNQVSNSSPVGIAGRVPYNSDGVQVPFKGNIGIIRFYNKSLTSTEVLQNFNTYKSRYGL